jgi:undecaprenyl-diphosphatase
LTITTKRHLGLGLLAAFAILAMSVVLKADWVTSLDSATRQVASQTISPLNTTLLTGVAFLGSPATAIGLTLVLCGYLWYRKAYVTSIWIAGIQFSGAAIAEIIKQLVARPRPTQQLIADTGFSFPSGHTFCTAILIFSLLVLCWPYLQNQESQLVAVLLGLAWLAFVASSRVYFRDHYVTDVFASVLLASGYWLVLNAYRATLQLWIKRMLPKKYQLEVNPK